jgi:all-trans-retinol 13,14-reductase
MNDTGSRFDAIVIGSGIGGLACACALSHSGYRVLVLERHFAPGGLTQTFSRNGFKWAVGVHYLGDMGEGGAARQVLDWLSDGALRFAPAGAVYDTVHLPDGFELQFARSQAALVAELKERFPASVTQIDAFFAALAEAERAGHLLFARRAMPALLGKVFGFWRGSEIERWWGRTTDVVLAEMIADPRLRAVLAAQRGDYGPDPRESSFGIHATVMRHYMNGAYFPIGGADAFAESLVPVVVKSGGEVRTRAPVSAILVENEAVAGVRLENGTDVHCPLVLSDAGAHNTIMHLLPPRCRESEWARELLSFRPSACHIGMYLGFDGDIRACGATSSNHWFYQSLDLADALWRDPASQPVPPALYVTFPSLKHDTEGPAHDSRHTAELVTFTDWDVFSRWENSQLGRRPPDYLELKEKIRGHLLAQFAQHFPALAPLIAEIELSTPLSSVAFVGAEHGGVYGLEPSPRRFLSTHLHARTPLPGLYLTGQDVCSTGITGAMMGGVMSAAAIEPRLLTHLA